MGRFPGSYQHLRTPVLEASLQSRVILWMARLTVSSCL
jgi:hypothetical protein